MIIASSTGFNFQKRSLNQANLQNQDPLSSAIDGALDY